MYQEYTHVSSITVEIDMKRLLNVGEIHLKDLYTHACAVNDRLEQLGYSVRCYADRQTDTLDLVFGYPHTNPQHPYNLKVIEIACAVCLVQQRKTEEQTDEQIQTPTV